ncbi:NUDIX hydrolase [Gryllotalpicola protaetiae]|uniref:NUDIX hydrolase n=1 Tax=Gryllotalpicola protaetiae TaxID=2419771 RepID=A0A387BN19_9MICO|nr:NUDIX domain-containing protein [Gryllotalpicola protaetiae]AYG03812.1 NUDIX hydrolase [Gryllotalpicola protaetiae]
MAEVSLAVSTVIFALRSSGRFGDDEGQRRLWLPLVRRIREPFDGRWALPGGPLGSDEGLAEAATSTLAKTTGLAPRYLEQLYAFGDPGRSGEDASRVVSVVYWALVGDDEAKAARVGQNVRWFPADELPPLAFDHQLVVEYALWRLRNKVEYSRIASAFLGAAFTLAQLREVYEAVLGRALDPANFRRQIEASGAVEDTGEVLTGVRHRPPRLYRYNSTVDLADQGPLGRLAQK